ncbi:MAG: selenophosphate synthase [Bryobacterales bacterium]|nr:selenophosphate synthase [Bryobacterales bacterium]
MGFDTADDAGVFRISDELALVQTVDFFTPVVDDPYTFGAIAAANALSDVYAMGGRPISALSIVAFPGTGDMDVLGEILRGGLDKMMEAECALMGGHSVNDPEIKFGYAVTGVIHPDRIKGNRDAKEGDAVVFTKALGTGVIGTALKKGIASEPSVEAAAKSMLTLNRAACEAMLKFEVHGCTDVTGFGMIAHAREMAVASGVTIEIEAARVPLLPGALEAWDAGAIPQGLRNNQDFASCAAQVTGTVDPRVEGLLYDPQTSGGLLITLSSADADALVRAFPAAVRIGWVLPRGEKPIQII